MQPTTMRVLSVTEAATRLGVAPRTVRRWLQEGLLTGKKVGTAWVVLSPEIQQERDGQTAGPVLPWRAPSIPALIRQRLRQLGTRLITVGNAMAEAHRAPGEVFLTWRRPERLQITFAIGRISPTRGWVPHALGLELPFWLKERQRWRQAQHLLRRYEQLRLWCHPQLLRLSQVQEVVEAEIHRVHSAVEVCAAQQTTPDARQTSHADSPYTT
jgi:excisionase family DNA binding protein